MVKITSNSTAQVIILKKQRFERHQIQPRLFVSYRFFFQVYRKHWYLLVALAIVLIVYLNPSRPGHITKLNVFINNFNGDRTRHKRPTTDDSFIATETNRTVREIYYCYHKHRHDVDVNLLEDVQLSKRQPRLDTTIFFVITTCLNDSLVEIRKR